MTDRTTIEVAYAGLDAQREPLSGHGYFGSAADLVRRLHRQGWQALSVYDASGEVGGIRITDSARTGWWNESDGRVSLLLEDESTKIVGASERFAEMTLRLAREARNVRLGDLTGVNTATVRRWLNDNPTRTADESDHAVVIEEPDTVGHWAWTCVAYGCDANASGYDDPEEVLEAATRHAPLAAHSPIPVWIDVDGEQVPGISHK